MRKSVTIRFVALASCLATAGCATLTQVQVSGPLIAQYHVLTPGEFARLSGDNAARVRAMRQNHRYGPFASNVDNPLRGEGRYYFFPVCGGDVQWSNNPITPLTRQPRQTIPLHCP